MGKQKKGIDNNIGGTERGHYNNGPAQIVERFALT
jgi:hypothetical protein